MNGTLWTCLQVCEFNLIGADTVIHERQPDNTAVPRTGARAQRPAPAQGDVDYLLPESVVLPVRCATDFEGVVQLQYTAARFSGADGPQLYYPGLVFWCVGGCSAGGHYFSPPALCGGNAAHGQKRDATSADLHEAHHRADGTERNDYFPRLCSVPAERRHPGHPCVRADRLVLLRAELPERTGAWCVCPAGVEGVKV